MARPNVTRKRVRQLLEEGKTAVEIAALLGVNKSTVCYHRRRLGEEIDGRFARRYDCQAVQRYHDEGHSMTECKERFGFGGLGRTSKMSAPAVLSATTKPPRW